MYRMQETYWRRRASNRPKHRCYGNTEQHIVFSSFLREGGGGMFATFEMNALIAKHCIGQSHFCYKKRVWACRLRISRWRRAGLAPVYLVFGFCITLFMTRQTLEDAISGTLKTEKTATKRKASKTNSGPFDSTLSRYWAFAKFLTQK